MVRRKSFEDLVYDRNLIRLRTEGRLILAEVMNEAVAEMTQVFERAQKNKTPILELESNPEEIRAMLLRASLERLAPAPTIEGRAIAVHSQSDDG